MILNADKCLFMFVGKDTENETFIFNNFISNNSSEEKILGITMDNKLSLKSHIKILCKNAAQKIGTLFPIGCYGCFVLEHEIIWLTKFISGFWDEY